VHAVGVSGMGNSDVCYLSYAGEGVIGCGIDALPFLFLLPSLVLYLPEYSSDSGTLDAVP
jgi:hypothetical protein